MLNTQSFDQNAEQSNYYIDMTQFEMGGKYQNETPVMTPELGHSRSGLGNNYNMHNSANDH